MHQALNNQAMMWFCTETYFIWGFALIWGLWYSEFLITVPTLPLLPIEIVCFVPCWLRFVLPWVFSVWNYLWKRNTVIWTRTLLSAFIYWKANFKFTLEWLLISPGALSSSWLAASLCSLWSFSMKFYSLILSLLLITILGYFMKQFQTSNLKRLVP